MTSDTIYRLRKGTRWRQTAEDTIIFVTDKAVPVRVSNQVTVLLPPLEAGATLEELSTVMRPLSERHADQRQLSRLMSTLAEFGVVDDGRPWRKLPLRWLLDIGALVERLGLERARRPIAVLASLTLAAAAFALAVALSQKAVENPVASIFRLEWVPFALVILLLVPLHEFGHVLAAIASGTPLGRLGARVSGRLIVRPFVETLPPREGEPPLKPVIVALGGPAMDLFNASAAATIALFAEGRTASYAGAVAGLSLLMGFRNIGPGRRKDGFKLVTWLLKTEPQRLAPKRGSGPPAPAAAVYRRIRIAYNLAFVLILAWLFYDGVPWSRLYHG